MTAPTINGTRYPQPLDELLPAARTLAAELGDVPSRNRLMREFRIGAPKADELRNLLAAEALHRDLAEPPAAPVDEPEPVVPDPQPTPAVPEPAPVTEATPAVPATEPVEQVTAPGHPGPARRAGRGEAVVLVAILLVVGLAAGAASFTHVHDWTMANSPAGTPGWFGWANACISELVPVASLLEIRRRRRSGAPVGYPVFLLVASAALSLAAQLAVAKPSVSGWLLSAVPALAFIALVKLVLAPAGREGGGRG